MNPTISSTAAGSRITVYFPAGISRGRAESNVFHAATSANASGSRLAASGEFAFCHPEESPDAANLDPLALAEVAAWKTLDSDRKSTRLNSSHQIISYAVFCF